MSKRKFKETKIHVDKLDNFIEAVVDSFIAIKIDVEGHELQTLHSMRNILRNNKQMYFAGGVLSFSTYYQLP
mgnify:CR=1 FL=1